MTVIHTVWFKNVIINLVLHLLHSEITYIFYIYITSGNNHTFQSNTHDKWVEHLLYLNSLCN